MSKTLIYRYVTPGRNTNQSHVVDKIGILMFVQWNIKSFKKMNIPQKAICFQSVECVMMNCKHLKPKLMINIENIWQFTDTM